MVADDDGMQKLSVTLTTAAIWTGITTAVRFIGYGAGFITLN